MDPVLLIHLSEGRLYPEPHVSAQLLGWPAKGSGLAKEDTPVGDAGLFRTKRGTRNQQRSRALSKPATQLSLRLTKVRQFLSCCRW